MELPRADYTNQSFIAYLKEHGEDVAPPDPRHRWLKIYVVLSNGADWADKLFSEEEVAQLGDIKEIRIRSGENRRLDRDENYYVMEYSEGLLLFFTTAIKEQYERTLGERLKRTRGITPLWLAPGLFDRQWKFLLRQTDGIIHRFMSRRVSMDELTNVLRPDIQRRFNYTGNDGTQVLEELRERYGVFPQSIYINVNPELTIHLTNEGLFSAKILSRQALEMFFGMLDLVREEVVGLKDASQQLSFKIETVSAETTGPVRIASVKSGLIRLPQPQLDSEAISRLKMEISKKGQFSLIDEQLVAGSLGYSATVVDERKGSVFNISLSENQILLVPKYNYTFESFISFYRTVAEVADTQATFALYE